MKKNKLIMTLMVVLVVAILLSIAILAENPFGADPYKSVEKITTKTMKMLLESDGSGLASILHPSVNTWYAELGGDPKMAYTRILLENPFKNADSFLSWEIESIRFDNSEETESSVSIRFGHSTDGKVPNDIYYRTTLSFWKHKGQWKLRSLN